MDEKNQAMIFAMKLIGLRRRSVFEIEDRLKRKNYQNETISEVVEELKKFKYLDDEAFAESFINDRINLKPCGKRLIKRELQNKNVSAEIIENKLNLLIDDNKELELAERLALKKIRLMGNIADKNKVCRKLTAYLSSRGFSFDIIGQALKNKLK